MQIRSDRRTIEIALASAAVVALALVELAGLSAIVLVGLGLAELFVSAVVGGGIVRSRRGACLSARVQA